MTPARIASISICFVAAGVGCCFLTRATLGGSPQQVSSQPRSPHSRRSDAAKHAWHSVPASTPPETEIIPPPPPALPPATSLGFGPEGNHAEAAPASSEVRSPFRLFVGAGAHWRQFATWKQAPTVSGGQREHAKASEPEAHRIRDELERLRDNRGARQAFYDELRRTLEEVRNNTAPRGAAVASPEPSPVVGLTREAPDEPSQAPASSDLHQPRPSGVGSPQAWRDSSSSAIDRAAYRRVVRWAKANGTPVPLALAVAWMESHLETYPPQGAAGEVGMYQIMPARCEAEGWPSERLKEPEFNAWMGTLLLARYYGEEGDWARAAAKYVAGPGVFEKKYSKDMWTYINWYSNSVNSYADYFSRYASWAPDARAG
ncbi:MAG TPA: transglycosylase SLT domain-containing protein [Terriglobia bacterium]|nr:transglycosylase SLT domain-containing protein [Terriglobia bacterium]